VSYLNSCEFSYEFGQPLSEKGTVPFYSEDSAKGDSPRAVLKLLFVKFPEANQSTYGKKNDVEEGVVSKTT
jgi:hypothetical protein